jgi:hypothetical protein
MSCHPGHLLDTAKIVRREYADRTHGYRLGHPDQPTFAAELPGPQRAQARCATGRKLGIRKYKDRADRQIATLFGRAA